MLILFFHLKNYSIKIHSNLKQKNTQNKTKQNKQVKSKAFCFYHKNYLTSLAP